METTAFEEMLQTLVSEGYAVEFSPKPESNEIDIFVYIKSGNLRQVESTASGVNFMDTMQDVYMQVPEKNDALRA